MPTRKGKIRGESPRAGANPRCDIAFPEQKKEQKKQEKRSKTEMLSISDSSLTSPLRVTFAHAQVGAGGLAGDRQVYSPDWQASVPGKPPFWTPPPAAGP